MIPFTHKVNARSRSLKLSIAKNGSVTVTTPRFTPGFIIRKFVSDHQEWITQQQAKLSTLQTQLKLKEDQVLLFGKVYTIHIKLDAKKPIGINRVGDTLSINPISDSKASITRSLDRFLKNTGSAFILKQTQILAKKMNTTYNKISFKTQKTRWGSCSSKGNLNFNWRLVHSPPEVITYVIVHELAHRTHMNHSLDFWKLVEKFDPEYRKHRGWLKRHGMALND